MDISFSPGCNDRAQNHVWIIPEDQLPKIVTITACGGPPGGTYEWTFVDTSVAEAIRPPDGALDLPSIQVRVLTGGNFTASCSYTVAVDGHQCAARTEVFGGAVVNKVRLESVEFSGGYDVLRDDGTAYPSPAWKDANLDGDADDPGDHKFPIAFTRDTPWRVFEAIVRIEPPDVQVGTVTLTMTSQGKPTIEAESQQIAGGLRFSSDLSDTRLPNVVDYDASLPITWKLDFGCESEPNTKSFTTRHSYYVTLGTPQEQLHHTILHIGCKNAKEMATADAVVAGIWSEFATGVEDGVLKADQPVIGPPSPPMRYWNPPVDDHEDPINGATPFYREMLRRPAANGQCGAWASLLLAAIRVQGITDAQKLRIAPPAPVLQMMVKHWTFNGPGSQPGCAPFIFGLQDLGEGWGIAGQGNPDPPPFFGNHFIVFRNGLVYDPSYGAGPFQLLDAWENAALDGWSIGCPAEVTGDEPEITYLPDDRTTTWIEVTNVSSTP